MKNVSCLCVLCLSLASSLAGERVVSVGGGITEILHALELEESIVGVDTSSVYPESVTGMPQVGYARALSAEGVLSLNPTLVVCSEDAGPPDGSAAGQKFGSPDSSASREAVDSKY
jgi:iron complex transport system substrate-binding protein